MRADISANFNQDTRKFANYQARNSSIYEFEQNETEQSDGESRAYDVNRTGDGNSKKKSKGWWKENGPQYEQPSESTIIIDQSLLRQSTMDKGDHSKFKWVILLLLCLSQIGVSVRSSLKYHLDLNHDFGFNKRFSEYDFLDQAHTADFVQIFSPIIVGYFIDRFNRQIITIIFPLLMVLGQLFSLFYDKENVGSEFLLGFGESGIKVCQMITISYYFSASHSMTLALAIFSSIVPTIVYQFITATWSGLMLHDKIIEKLEGPVSQKEFNKTTFLEVESGAVIGSYICLALIVAIEKL